MIEVDASRLMDEYQDRLLVVFGLTREDLIELTGDEDIELPGVTPENDRV